MASSQTIIVYRGRCEQMGSIQLRKELERIIKGPSYDGAISEELYYFMLAQVLVYVFEELGGCNRYRNQFNYLINPYIPRDIQNICKRVLHFLDNAFVKLKIESQNFERGYHLLCKYRERHIKGRINRKACEDAFYSGLHSDNVFNDRQTGKNEGK
jgi:hypothetical protein